VKDVAELLAEQLESTGNSSIDRSIVADNADHP
jgi:hypothetical protein